MQRYVIVIAILLTLHGCAQQAAKTVLPIPVAEIKVEAAADASIKRITPTQVVIFVSEDIPAYSEVAKSLSKLLGGKSNIQYLGPNSLENLKTVSKFKNDANVQIVSIGLNASIAAKTLISRQVIFCQVYNYQDHTLLSSKHKGVSILPSLSKSFATWRTLSPRTTDIGLINGPGMEDVMQAAKAAAQTYGFKLHYETVNTDKEYQYAYKKISPKVQGYWLLPDNRVLSENILRDIMNFSVRNNKQVVVFNDELLKLGGLFSIGSEYRDIAQQVFERLEQAQTTDAIPGPDLVYPEKIKFRINSIMAQRLNINIPKQYGKFANAP
jgi:hypothetical protein